MFIDTNNVKRGFLGSHNIDSEYLITTIIMISYNSKWLHNIGLQVASDSPPSTRIC